FNSDSFALRLFADMISAISLTVRLSQVKWVLPHDFANLIASSKCFLCEHNPPHTIYFAD
ncbi:MAG: hypothetical protein WCC72_09655, partial [Dehalococcoidales bacterium]